MKKTKHTTGKWNAVLTPNSHRWKVISQETTVCDVGFALMGRDSDEELAEFIAAAPETASKLTEAQSALAALMEYTLGFAAGALSTSDYCKFCDHPAVKTAQEIVAQNSARG